MPVDSNSDSDSEGRSSKGSDFSGSDASSEHALVAKASVSKLKKPVSPNSTPEATPEPSADSVKCEFSHSIVCDMSKN
jgi:hypothetical protein